MIKTSCICTNLRQAAQSSTAFYDAMLAPSGLKVTMFRLLRQVSQNDGVTITALAALVDLERSTLGRNLKVLEKAGLVALSTGQDERARVVTLTPQGADALAQALPLWGAAQDQLQDTLGTDLDGLLATLAKVSKLRPATGKGHM